SARYLVTSWPRTLLPAASSGGEKVARPPLPGDTVTMPPLTPLLPGIPISYSQSPDNSYRPAVAITARTRRPTPATTTRSPVIGFNPPSASDAQIARRIEDQAQDSAEGAAAAASEAEEAPVEGITEARDPRKKITTGGVC